MANFGFFARKFQRCLGRSKYAAKSLRRFGDMPRPSLVRRDKMT
jgi:hypothetical protein